MRDANKSLQSKLIRFVVATLRLVFWEPSDTSFENIVILNGFVLSVARKPAERDD